jgi:hypothetical protein
VVGEQEILGDFCSKAHIGCTYVERHEDTAPDGKSPDLAVLLRDARSGRLSSPYTFADVCNISIDEARYDRRLSSIERPGPLTRELPDLPAAPYGYGVVILHCERFSLRQAGVDGVNPGVEDDMHKQIDGLAVLGKRGAAGMVRSWDGRPMLRVRLRRVGAWRDSRALGVRRHARGNRRRCRALRSRRVLRAAKQRHTQGPPSDRIVQSLSRL